MIRHELERWLQHEAAGAFDAEAGGPHLDDERLAVLAESRARPEGAALHHLARCEACREVYINLAAEHPTDIRRWRPSVLLSAVVGTVGAAAAAAALLLVPAIPASTLTADVLPGPTNTRGAAAVGDTLHVQASFPSGAHGELRVYLEGVAPVVRCPGAAGCRADPGALGVDLVLDRRGRYRILLITAPHPISSPFTTFADDYDALPEDVDAREVRVEVF